MARALSRVTPAGDAGARSVAAASAGAVSVATVTILPLSLGGALAVQVSQDLGVSVSALGAVSSAFFGAATLMSPLSGAVVARTGARTAMRLSLAITACVLVAVALGARSLPTLLCLLALGGVANALAQPATNLYLAQRVAPRRQGTAYGIKQSAIPAAGLLAGIAVPVVALTVGWRWAFALFAVPALVLALRPPGGDELPGWSGPTRGTRTLPRAFLLVIALGAGLAAACSCTLGIFLVSGAVEAGWGEAEAGLVFALASASAVVGRLVAGVRADQRGALHLEVIAVMLVLGAVGFAGLASGSHLLYAAGSLVAFGIGWGWPGLLILSVVQLSPAAPADATALTQMGTSAGAAVGPLAFGLLVERASYGAAWLTAAGGLLLAAAVLLAARRLVPDLAPVPDASGAVPVPAPAPGDRMSPHELVLAYFAACSMGDADGIAAAFCDDAVIYDTNHRPVRGADAIGRFYRHVREQRQGASWHIDTFLGDGQRGASEWTMLDPSGSEPVAVRGSEHYEFRDGRIGQIRQYWRYDPDWAGTGLRDFPYEQDTRFTPAGSEDAVGGL